MADKQEFIPTQLNDIASSYDVAVIGAGATGLVSALELTKFGKKVVVFEKMPKPGGNSMRASSGMNAAETHVQRQNGIIDSYESFFDDTYKGGNKTNNVDMLRYFTTHADSAVEWLKEQEILLDQVTLTGGMSQKRAHRPSNAPAIGGYLIHNLLNDLVQRKVPIVCKADVSQVETKDDKYLVDINGEKQIQVSVVIIATGGFAANTKLVAKYRDDLKEYQTTNHPGAQGEGLKLGEELGGHLVDMDQIQVHPTVYQDGDHPFLIGEMVRGEGAILVNHEGRRFVDELDTRKVVTDAINDQQPADAYLIFNQELANRAKAVQFYDAIGLVEHGDTIADLAEKLNLPVKNLEKTMQKWQQVIKSQKDSEFGRTMGLVDGFEQGPYAAIHVAPALHYTMGGLQTSARSEVLDQHQNPIPGLYAAGEVVGGLHGQNRIGGNSIAETVVFGLQAARQAFKYLK